VLLKHQPWADGSETGSHEVQWNMWQRRLVPYYQLEVGSQVVLVGGGGPAGGMLTWKVEATEVVRGRYGSHDAAWSMVRTGLRNGIAAVGVTRGGFLRSDYTVRSPDSGWLLAWSYRPMRQIMRPRPRELRMGRHGWLLLNDSDLEDLLDSGTAAGNPGQGRIRDAARRAAIERRAMDVVHDWLVGQGHAEGAIRDTSASCPYDYEVGPVDRPVLRVEVKGLSGGLGPVEITDGEVRSARSGVETVLAVVYGIDVVEGSDGRPTGRSGSLWHEWPWNPRDADLVPTRYRYTSRALRPAAGRGAAVARFGPLPA
jgi:hypothetical protein